MPTLLLLLAPIALAWLRWRRRARRRSASTSAGSRRATVTPYYEDERHGITLYCGDCRDVLPTLDAVDHVITDPPYEAETHTLGRRGNTARDGDRAYFSTRALDFTAIDEDVRCFVGGEFARLANGWVLVFCQVEAAMLWRDVVQPAKYMRTQIWRKITATPQMTGDRPGMGYESICTSWAGEGRSRWNGGGQMGIYEFLPVRGGTGHMTEKPEALMVELLQRFTDPGETILDPFAGSGTTLVAAKILGRKAIGIELEEKWCEVTKQRLLRTAYKPPLFSYGRDSGKQQKADLTYAEPNAIAPERAGAQMRGLT